MKSDTTGSEPRKLHRLSRLPSCLLSTMALSMIMPKTTSLKFGGLSCWGLGSRSAASWALPRVSIVVPFWQFLFAHGPYLESPS